MLAKRRGSTRLEAYRQFRRSRRFFMLPLAEPRERSFSGIPSYSPKYDSLNNHMTAAIVCRGVRGATTVNKNDREDILSATRQMLALIIRRNEMDPADVASAQFTVTSDLTEEFPALAARQLGWIEVPLLCGYEISVPNSLPLCIRVLLHWNTPKTQTEIQHVYLHEARRLRPDLTKVPPVDFEELERWIATQMGEESDD